MELVISLTGLAIVMCLVGLGSNLSSIADELKKLNSKR